jgi:hypothetical protein
MTLCPLPAALGSWFCSEMETVFPAVCLLWVSSRSEGKFLPVHQTFYPHLCPQTYCTVRKVITITVGVETTQSLTWLPIWLYWVWFPAGVCDLSLPKHPVLLRGPSSVVFDPKLRVLSPEVKQSGRESDQSTQSFSQVTKTSSCASFFVVFRAATWALPLFKLHNKESRFSVEDVRQDYSLSDQRERANFK